MSVGVLVITHNRIGEEMLATATAMLGVCPLPAEALAVAADCDPDRVADRARRLADDLDQGDGVLVLTDLYGSTPSNIANRLLDGARVRVVTGVNLPMLIRVLNYPRLSLSELVHKARTGGRDGVMACEPEPRIP